MQYTQIFESVTLEGLKKIAENIAPRLTKGDIITLNGDLGAGKTQFANFLINSLSKSSTKINVTSPTFNILQIYNLEKFDIFHFDLYRIEKKLDLMQLGLEDIITMGVSIVEWPAVASHLFKFDVININIEFIEGNDIRKVEINHRWEKEIVN